MGTRRSRDGGRAGEAKRTGGESDAARPGRPPAVTEVKDAGVAPLALVPARVEMPRSVEELRELVVRARRGNREVLPQVREMLRRDLSAALPVLCGDLARPERGIARRLAGGNPAAAEGLVAAAERLKGELAGAGASPLERLLVERVVLCWLQVQAADDVCLRGDAGSLTHAEHRDRLRDRAHRRLLLAAKTLATVRKLALPSIQVNIGERQVNVQG